MINNHKKILKINLKIKSKEINNRKNQKTIMTFLSYNKFYFINFNFKLKIIKFLEKYKPVRTLVKKRLK